MEFNVFSENSHARGKALQCSKLNALSDVKNTLHSARKPGKAVLVSNTKTTQNHPDNDDQHNHQYCELMADKEMERDELRFTKDMINYYSNFGVFTNPSWKQFDENSDMARFADIEDKEWIFKPFLEDDDIMFMDYDIQISVPSPQ